MERRSTTTTCPVSPAVHCRALSARPLLSAQRFFLSANLWAICIVLASRGFLFRSTPIPGGIALRAGTAGK